MKQFIKKIVAELPPIKRLLKFRTHWGPGHYYSAIPDANEAIQLTGKQQAQALPVNGIAMNDERQLSLFGKLVPFMQKSLFRNEEKTGTHRFYNKNGIYGYSDALILESMILHLQPSKIIEVGSGHTSALMLDINDKYFTDRPVSLSFIEPYPERLFSLLSEKDKEQVTLHICGVQTVDLDVFRSLKANDILFIDSSHVAKTGSDLLHLLFEVLPVLNEGVYIHFHDIFINFEYTPSHFKSFPGFSWNESYFLRSFLMYNPKFEIVLYSQFLESKYKKNLLSLMADYPLATGAQIWIRKI